jgi:glycosyltransferase involved in cell wall biosynthesis
MGLTKIPRVVIYCPGSGSGGPWRYVHSILRDIDLQEFQVSLISDFTEHYTPRPEIRVIPISEKSARDQTTSPGAGSIHGHTPVKPKNFRTLRLWAGFKGQAFAVAKRFREDSFDLLHTQNTGCEESPVAARLAGIPIILGTFHVDSTYDLTKERSGIPHRTLEHISNHCLTHAIGVSRKTSEDWISRTHLPRHKVTTIYNGIDPEKFKRKMSRIDARMKLKLPQDAIIVGGLGRLDPAKGYIYLIEAVAQLAESVPQLYAAIAGQGPLRESLEAQSIRLGIADRIRFLEFQVDVQPVLDALDIFIIPSLCEALPYALLEAMATELPAIGTVVGGVPEVINADTGLLVPPKNSDAIAEAIMQLANSSELRSRMGRAGRRRVIEHFQEKEMVRKTIDLYRGLLTGRN